MKTSRSHANRTYNLLATSNVDRFVAVQDATGRLCVRPFDRKTGFFAEYWEEPRRKKEDREPGHTSPAEFLYLVRRYGGQPAGRVVITVDVAPSGHVILRHPRGVFRAPGLRHLHEAQPLRDEGFSLGAARTLVEFGERAVAFHAHYDPQGPAASAGAPVGLDDVVRLLSGPATPGEHQGAS